MLNIKNDLNRFQGMHLQQTSFRRRLLWFIAAFALIGTYFLIRTFALETNTISGNLEVIHGDVPSQKKSVVNYYLTTSDGDTRKVDIEGAKEEDFRSGPVTISNASVDPSSKTLKTTSQSVQQQSTASAATGARKTAVVMFRYANDPTTPPLTVEQVREDFFTDAHKLNGFLKEESNNNVRLTGKERSDGDVFSYFTLEGSAPANNCFPAHGTSALNDIVSKLTVKVAVFGHNLNDYDHVVFLAPDELCADGALGWGDIGGKHSWVRFNNQEAINDNSANHPSWMTAVHELTHNFGTDHADELECKSANGLHVPVSDNCIVYDYGDSIDSMGQWWDFNKLPVHSSSYFQYSVGWLPENQTQTISRTGDYSLLPAENNSGGIKLLRILRTSKGSGGSQYYDLEYRQPTGYFDSQINNNVVFRGATIRLDHIKTPDGKTSDGYITGLIDTQASEIPGSEQLADGRTFVDPDYKVSIKQISHDSNGVKLHISLGDDVHGDKTPPSKPPSAKISQVDSKVLLLTWGKSTDNVGVVGYRVYKNNALFSTQSELGMYDQYIKPDTKYTYGIAAYDAAGNEGERSILSINTKPGGSGIDSTPPTAPTNVIATAASTSQINLSWTASTDNVGVDHYQIFRDGNPVGTSTSTTFTDSVGLGPGQTHTYSIFAFDAAGNKNVFNTSQVATGSTLPGDTTPPTAPSGVVATAVSSSQINLSWYSSTDNPGGSGVAYYKIYNRGNFVVSTSYTYFNLTGLTPNTTYVFAIHAVDNAGNESLGVPSDEATATTPDNGDHIGPSAPYNVRATTDSSTEIDLTWSPSIDNPGGSGLDYYKIFRDGNSIGWTRSTYIRDSYLLGGSIHTYAIHAFDKAGNENIYNVSETARAQTFVPSGYPPSPPTNLDAHVNTDWTNVSWTSSDSTDVVGYLVDKIVSRTYIYRNLGIPINTPEGFGDEASPNSTYCVRTLSRGGIPSLQTCAPSHY